MLDRHYVFAYCSPTRGSLLTGRYPHHDHQLNLGNDLVAPVNTNMTMLASQSQITHQNGAKSRFEMWVAIADPSTGGKSRLF